MGALERPPVSVQFSFMQVPAKILPNNGLTESPTRVGAARP